MLNQSEFDRKGVYSQVEKIKGLEIFSLWQRLTFCIQCTFQICLVSTQTEFYKVISTDVQELSFVL